MSRRPTGQYEHLGNTVAVKDCYFRRQFVSSVPVDATTTPAWNKLSALAADFKPDLRAWFAQDAQRAEKFTATVGDLHVRSEEHTSELQSRGHLVCRLLLEKKKNRSRIRHRRQR